MALVNEAELARICSAFIGKSRASGWRLEMLLRLSLEFMIEVTEIFGMSTREVFVKNSFYQDLAEMATEALHALEEFEKSKDTTNSNIFKIINGLSVPCLEGGYVKREILEEIPPRGQAEFASVVSKIKSLSALQGGCGNSEIKSAIILFRRVVTELSQRTKRSGTPKVFYSWQATLDGSANRNLIRKCLALAIDNLNQELEVEGRDEAMLDSDTANTPGSPDIIRTILSKVDESTIFIADITLVNEKQPNSNVMFELGYALKALGEANIILLFNEHYGSPRDLPFDLGLKRAMLYRCSPDDEEKAPVRKELSARLKGAIDMILKETAD